MFDIELINTAKSKINEEVKAFLTSDSSVYIIKRDQNITHLLEHCSKNDLTLFDVEENKEISIKIKKAKQNGTTEG